MSKHFGVGFADQVVAAVCEQFSKGLVVLDDAIVDDCNASLTSGVRVCVHVARGAVCGPPRVSYAHSALGFVFPNVGFQVGHFALLLFDAQQVLVFQRGDARAVITPVFEAFQPVNEDGVGFLGPEVSDNSTHGARANFG